jgi:esterase/lipase superfamily enzyme
VAVNIAELQSSSLRPSTQEDVIAGQHIVEITYISTRDIIQKERFLSIYPYSIQKNVIAVNIAELQESSLRPSALLDDEAVYGKKHKTAYHPKDLF